MRMTEQIRDLLMILIEVDLDFTVKSSSNEIVVGEYLIKYDPLLSDFTIMGEVLYSYSSVQGVANHVLGLSI